MVDRALWAVLWVAKRVDPTVTGLHTVRTTRPDWGGGLNVVEDACMTPGRGMVGDFPDYPARGVHSVDFPYGPRSKVTITTPKDPT